MKISKIPGLGRFGSIIEGLDFDHLTDEEWMEIGKRHLTDLVTIFKDIKLDVNSYAKWNAKWGPARFSSDYEIRKIYNLTSQEIYEKIMNNDPSIAEEHKNLLIAGGRVLEREDVVRVTPNKDSDGNSIGLFGQGELQWHSNEFGRLHHSPAVSLLSSANVAGSATGFLTTTDWYENQSESFRSELDEMVLVHRFDFDEINPGGDKTIGIIYERSSGCYTDSEIPLVMTSVGGIKGLHWSPHVFHGHGIKGMSTTECNRLLDIIRKGLFDQNYIYDHWYAEGQQDLLIFDNSITLHRRLNNPPGRMLYRIQFDYTHLQTHPWYPYSQAEYKNKYKTEITELVEITGLKDFKLPE